MGHASTCNTTGQTIGEMLGAMFPVLLTSEDFCNKYLRNEPDTGGIVTMASKKRLCYERLFSRRFNDNRFEKIVRFQDLFSIADYASIMSHRIALAILIYHLLLRISIFFLVFLVFSFFLHSSSQQISPSPLSTTPHNMAISSNAQENNG